MLIKNENSNNNSNNTKFTLALVQQQEISDIFSFSVNFTPVTCTLTHGPVAVICGETQICIVRPIAQSAHHFEHIVYTLGTNYTACKLVFDGYVLNDDSCYVCTFAVKKHVELYEFVHVAIPIHGGGIIVSSQLQLPECHIANELELANYIRIPASFASVCTCMTFLYQHDEWSTIMCTIDSKLVFFEIDGTVKTIVPLDFVPLKVYVLPCN